MRAVGDAVRNPGVAWEREVPRTSTKGIFLVEVGLYGDVCDVLVDGMEKKVVWRTA